MFNWFKKTAVIGKIAPESGVIATQGGDSITPLAMSESIAFKDRGNAYLNNDQLEEAAECFRQAIARNPRYAEAYTNLGLIFQMQGNLDEAVALYRKAVVCKPDLLTAHMNLGIALMNLGHEEVAEESFLQVIALDPEHVAALQSLGVIAFQHGTLAAQRGDFPHAETLLRRALELQPDYAEAHNHLGILLVETRRLSEAEASFHRALQIKQNYAEAYNNLGGALEAIGQLDTAVINFRRALAIKPDYAIAHSNLIFTLDKMVDVDTAYLQEERRRWNAAHAAHLHQHRVPSNRPDPERRLRIGYVSADFRMNSAIVVFGTMLLHFDRTRFDVIAYSNAIAEDAMTQIFKQSVTGWRKIVELSDDAVADLIRQDEIDILVDLSGHLMGHRLLVFARKPAPIQITAWGYIGGTGLDAMDVFFADSVIVPTKESPLYAEQVRYLPSVVGFSPPSAYPPVNALPALFAKGVTFGSFNRLSKNSKETYKTWAQILLAIPKSRMILKTSELDDVNTREQIMSYFTQAGIVPERIVLQGGTSHEQHLTAFNQIDISLDPFPHGGGVTALEGLMMGVPVITLRWPTLLGRLSASILTTLGLTDWIAESQEQYVALAIQKASDLQSLAELRQRLRGIFNASVIGDQAAYARAVEQEYRQLWQEWCASRSPPPNPLNETTDETISHSAKPQSAGQAAGYSHSTNLPDTAAKSRVIH